MAITRTVEQQFAHTVDVVKGGPVNARLEYTAPVSADAAGIFKGSLVSLNAEGKFVLGLPSAKAMPLWSKKNQNDPDVVSGSVDGNGTVLTASITGGQIDAYVATGGFELETTEFVAGTYEANTYLTAGADTNLGKVIATTEAPYGATAIVGIVSRGITAGIYKTQRLAFWPVFLPAKD